MKKFEIKTKKKISLLTITLVAFVYLTAFTNATFNNSDTDPKQSTKEIGPEDWADFKSWFKITKEPNTGDPTGFLDKKHRGEGAYRDVYVNSVGESLMRGNGSFPYPEGTVIVKEAFKDKKSYDAQKKPELTIMVKQATGTAPDTNDWMFVMGASGKAKGTGMDSKWGKFCGSCHVNAMAKDFTFMAADR